MISTMHTEAVAPVALEGGILAQDLHFVYPGRQAATLAGLSFEVRPGEFVLLMGPTGSGKSTLLKCLCGLIPHHSAGRLEGELLVDGRPVRALPPRALARHLAMVLQTPDTQLCAYRVEDEVAFGLENLEVPREELDRRIAAALDQVGLGDRRRSRVQALSGGQKQRLVLAAALAMGPRILLLDEPISQLDPQGAREIGAVLRSLKEAGGLTVVLSEHRVDELAPLIDRVLVLEAGRLTLDRTAQAAWRDLDRFRRAGLARPALAELGEGLELPERPLEVVSALGMLAHSGVEVRQEAERLIERTLSAVSCAPHPALEGESPARQADFPPLLRIEGLCHRYEERGPWAVSDITLDLRAGERVAILGANGSGKSTLLGCVAGVLEPTAGRVQVQGLPPRRALGRLGLMFQDPDLMLLSERVDEELAYAPSLQRPRPADLEDRVAKTLQALGLTSLSEEAPLALSRGQRLRVALGSILTPHPVLALLDEPTTGQDRRHVEGLLSSLLQHPSLRAWIFATHDVMLALRHATRWCIMARGKMLADGPPAVLLEQPGLFEAGGLVLPPLLELRAALRRKTLLPVGSAEGGV